MVSMSKSHSARRAINFDLNIEALRENYSVTNPKGLIEKSVLFLRRTDFFIVRVQDIVLKTKLQMQSWSKL